jgi:lysozyme
MAGMEGIDVSVIQGEIDWLAVRGSGVRWVYIRLCRGVDEVDTAAARNVQQATAAGVLVGVYHRVFPNLGSAELHASHFLSQYNRLSGVLPPVTLAPALDYEEKVYGGGPWCREYMAMVRGATGRARHVLYAPGSWFGTYIGTEGWADPATALWVADSGQYTGATKGHPKFQSPQTFAHQYGQTDAMPGVKGLCDLDVSISPLPLMKG